MSDSTPPAWRTSQQMSATIRCWDHKHKVVFAATSWGDFGVHSNSCDGRPKPGAGSQGRSCRDRLNELPIVAEALYQLSLLPTKHDYEPDSLPQSLYEKLRTIWSATLRDQFAVAETLLSDDARLTGRPRAEKIDVVRAELDACRRLQGAERRAKLWGCLVVIQKLKLAEMVPYLVDWAPRLSPKLLAKTAVVVAALAPAENFEIACFEFLGNVANDARLVAPLRETMVTKIATVSDPRVNPFLVGAWVDTPPEKQWYRLSTDGIRKRAGDALRERLIATRKESPVVFRDAVVMLFLDERGTRRAFIRLVVEIGAEDVSLWTELLSHSRWRVRIASIQVMVAINQRWSLDLLLCRLQPTPSDDVARAVETGMVQMLQGTDNLDRDLILALLRVNNLSVINATFDRLLAEDDSDPKLVTQLLIYLLSSSRDEIIQYAIRELHTLYSQNTNTTDNDAPSAGEASVYDALPRLLLLVANTGVDLIHRHFGHDAADLAVELIRGLPIHGMEELSLLEATLHGPHDDVAIAATQRLANSEVEGASAALENAMQDASPIVRAAIAECLSGILWGVDGQVAILPELARYVDEATGNIKLSLAKSADELLLQLGPNRVDIDRALQVLATNHMPLALKAIATLGRIGDLTAADMLTPLIERGFPDVACEAERAQSLIRSRVASESTGRRVANSPHKRVAGHISSDMVISIRERLRAK